MSAHAPWGVYRIGNMFAGSDVQAGLPDGRIVVAVCEPYHGNLGERIRAGWWVLTGRAHAVIWPVHGELEIVLHGPQEPPHDAK